MIAILTDLTLLFYFRLYLKRLLIVLLQLYLRSVVSVCPASPLR